MLIKLKKSTTKPPFDPSPFMVIDMKGSMVTARGAQQLTLDASRWKLIPDRTPRLSKQQRRREKNYCEDDDSASTLLDISIAEEGETVPVPLAANLEAAQAAQPEQEVSVPAPRRSNCQRQMPQYLRDYIIDYDEKRCSGLLVLVLPFQCVGLFKVHKSEAKRRT